MARARRKGACGRRAVAGTRLAVLARMPINLATFHRPLAIMAVAVAALGLLAVVARPVVRHLRAMTGEERWSAHELADEECTLYRALPDNHEAAVCRAYDRFAPSPIDQLRAMKASLADARARLARHDAAGAAASLLDAMAATHEVQRTYKEVGAMIASGIVDSTLDLLDADAAGARDLDARARRRILTAADLAVAARPLEAIRINHLWQLGEARATRAIAVADARRYAEMDRAVRAGNIAGCKMFARDLAATEPAGGGTSQCTIADQVIRTGARLDRARAALR